MAECKELKRVFIAGSTRLDDPVPGKSLDDAVRNLSQNYPQFRWSRLFLEDGVVVGDTVEFRLQLPPVKTKG